MDTPNAFAQHFPAGADRLVLIEKAKRYGIPIAPIDYSALSNGLGLWLAIHKKEKVNRYWQRFFVGLVALNVIIWGNVLFT